MKIADSRANLGLLPLQHQGYLDKKWDLDKRISIWGIRILDRLDKPGDVGHYLYDPLTAGDIHGGQFFKSDGKKRPTGMWRFATGVVVQKADTGVATPGAGNPGRPPVATPDTGQKPGASVPTTGGGGGILGLTFDSGSLNQGGAPIDPSVPSRPVGGDYPGDGSNTISSGGPLGGVSGYGGGIPTDNYNPSQFGDAPGSTTTGPGSGSTPTGPGSTTTQPTPIPASCQSMPGPLTVSPILDENYGPDLRLKKIMPAMMKLAGKSAMAKPAGNSLGITLTGNEENRQVDLFFPTDGRLIAVNFGGDVLCGSMVCDLAADSTIDPERTARLQALTWVIKHPNGFPNTLAWNIGPTGCRDTEGGYVIDDAENGGAPDGKANPVATPPTGTKGAPVATTGLPTINMTPPLPGIGNMPAGGGAGKPDPNKPPAKIVARVNRRYQGPFDVGTGHCLHFDGGTDDDKHNIGPLHLQWQYLIRENDVHCGPNNVTVWKVGQDLDFAVPVRYGWNPFLRKWDWWTTSPLIPIPYPYPTLNPNPYTPGYPGYPNYPVQPTPGGVPTPGRPVGGDYPGAGSTTVSSGGPVGGAKSPDWRSNLDRLLATGVAVPPVPPEPGTPGTGGDQPPAGGSPTPGGGSKPPDTHTPGTPYKPGEEAPTPWVDPPDPKPIDIGGGAPFQPNVVGTLMSSNPVAQNNLPFLLGAMALASPAGQFLAKAINYSPGKPNLMNGTANNALTGGDANGMNAAAAAAAAGPVSGILSAFAGEGGIANAGGGYARSVGAQGDPWVFNQLPGKSKYPCGTGPGGFCFMPPEVDLQHARNNGLVPPNTAVSTVYFMMGPNAWFAAGVPELADGTMKDGYRWGFDTATGDLVWQTHSNSQAAVEAMRFTKTSQRYRWMSGQSFYGEFAHANTANRVYTFPDKSGTVAMTSDVTTPGLYVATANKALNNSAVETTMFGSGVGSTVLPINAFTVGKTVRLVIAGFFTTGLTPQNLTIRLKLNSTTVASVTFAPITSATNLGWRVVADITCRTTGGAGTVIGQAMIVFDSTTLTASLVDFAVATATTTIDTTLTQQVDLTLQTALADAAATYTSTNAYLEAIN